jgi:hypothetical protein
MIESSFATGPLSCKVIALLSLILFSVFRGAKKVLGAIVGYLTQLYDACYWSITLLLGSADKAPTTNGGRILGESFGHRSPLMLPSYKA